MRKFYSKYQEIKEELKDLNLNQEGVFDSVIAPLFFVVTNNFISLNQAILWTAILLLLLFLYRLLRKQNLKFVFYGLIGTIGALALARIQGSASGFFIPGIVRDLLVAVIGLGSIIIKKPFTIYSSKAIRKWPQEWYLHEQIRPAYTRVAIIWTFYLFLKSGLQVIFFDSPEILVTIKLLLSNQTTLVLLVITYIIGQNKLQSLGGPSVDEFINATPPPWESQQKGF
ncbi:DUF3159 domain-containing protein [Candidatus Actinomarina]|nr:DUF3159 domain-containing protein [Candidatus Actinomarina sp.]